MTDGSSSGWLPIVQSFGIITGFLITFLTFLGTVRARKVSNYIEIIKLHRQLWMYFNDNYEELRYILSRNPELIKKKITREERQFLIFLFHHMSCYYELARRKQIADIEAAKADFANTLSYPLPRRYWEESKRYYNDGFVKFVDNAAPVKLPHKSS